MQGRILALALLLAFPLSTGAYDRQDFDRIADFSVTIKTVAGLSESQARGLSGRLLILDGLSPAGKLTQLMPQAPLHGSFWRPDLSFDAQKVLVSFKPHNEKAFHLYEVNVDGSGLVQLTDGIYDDFDPIYLPDEEHIVFSTSRAHTYVRCMPYTFSYVLARCNPDGSDVQRLTTSSQSESPPAVSADGSRVVFVRGSSNATENADVPSDLMSLYARTTRPVLNYRVSKTRWCVLRWPTPSMAQAAGMLAHLTAELEGRKGELYYLVKVDNARFNKIVVPGDQLRLEAEVTKLRTKFATIRGRALVDGEVAVEGELSAAVVELAEPP